jgi:hypothetical protein
MKNELTMSDEDFLNSYPEDFNTPSEPFEENAVQVEEEELESPENASEELTEEEVGESDEVPEEDEQSESDDKETEEDETDKGEESIDYEAQYKELLKPFKANGVDMQVQTVDEAIKLMQMGANYSKKMTALKPNLKKMKMLENNNLFDEDKLNLLIEVAKGNPEAISKVIKDSGINPLDLDIEGTEYTPKSHTVGDNEVELDEVISRIQDTSSFADTMFIVSSKWDESSKRSIASAPHQLEVLNEHVANGIYATVTAEVERQRMFGNLLNLSSLDAYKQVGEQLFNEGKITLGQPKKSLSKEVSTKPAIVKVDKNRKDKKLAASPTQHRSTPATETQYDPLAMSDADFEKLFN